MTGIHWSFRILGFAFCILITLVAGLPLLLPFAEAFLHGSSPDDDFAHLLPLAENTLALVAGSSLLALPSGLLLAVLFFRTNLPGRRFFVGATMFAVFIPLPLVVSAWQTLVGSDGLFPIGLWGANVSRPWSAGLLPAIWVYALTGLPWAILLVGVGLGRVESELEEEALLATGPWRVLWWVTLPRCRGTIVAAALWLALQAAADISVTDMLLVPTLAEEVHTRFTMGGRAAVAAALRLVAPALLLIWVFLLLLVPRLERSLPPLQLGFRRRPLFDLGRWRWLWLAGCVAAGVLVMIVPVLALVAKLGLAGSPRAWSAEHAGRQFAAEFRLYGLQVLETIIVALLTGALAAILALVACRGAEHGRGRRFLLLALVTLAWALPAPVVGIGLKETIQAIVRWCPNTPLPALLYDGPSPAPIVWAHVLRFFPFAVAIVWPALRMVPPELRDAARLEGAGAFQELVYVDWPMTRKACGLAALAVAALSLGEVGAGARVETPGWETFAKLLFDRMHYGVDASVAGLALVLLTEVLVFAACGLAISRCLAKPQAANH